MLIELFYTNFYCFFLEDFFIIFLIYNFFKILIITIINEIISSTQFFNKKFNISFQLFKNKNFFDFFNKIFNNNLFFLFYFKFINK